MKSKYIFSLLLALIAILVLNIGLSWMIFRNIADDGKQINDMGRIRGGIQRIVKLQYAGATTQDLIQQMDRQMSAMTQATAQEGAFSPQYQRAQRLDEQWQVLKQLLAQYAQAASPQNGAALQQASEQIWALADDAVEDFQRSDERTVYNMKYSIALICVDILLAVAALYMIKSYVGNELEFHANHDPLTKLYNRKYFMAVFSQLLKQAVRYEQDISVVLIDVDRFKLVNDTYGHVAGDKVLVDLGKVLTANTRKSDVVSRFGGEEFIVLLPNTDESSALQVADKLRHAVESHEFVGVGPVTISLGAYSYRATDDEDTMIHKADIALYQAKDAGRNRAVAYRDPVCQEPSEMG